VEDSVFHEVLSVIDVTTEMACTRCLMKFSKCEVIGRSVRSLCTRHLTQNRT
jgi:hypothetical protein